MNSESNAWKKVFRGPCLQEAFALTTEAVRRVTGKTFYDVQLLGGLSLTRGEIAEMQTGEGKTLTTALPAFVFALTGEGVHVATTNAYLAERDCKELTPVFQLLGLNVGLLPSAHHPATKRAAYQCDVTFGTGYEFGFDFLRDQLALRRQPVKPLGSRHLAQLDGRSIGTTDLLQRGHAFAIIDEADSVLLDEATMPLILSSAGQQPANDRLYELARHAADQLAESEHFVLHAAKKAVQVTDDGWQFVHEQLSASGLAGLQRPWIRYVEDALRARHFLHRDVDYVVRDNAVLIVDQHTGRIHDERTWRDGLHQAVEKHEGVPLSPEKQVDARISRQRYFQLYDHVCGMTGTATGGETEFTEFYGLQVRHIPTHRPNQRRTLETRVFESGELRDAAIAAEVAECHLRKQPVLIGTRTIQHSRLLSERLTKLGLIHRVLNGTQDESEAEIISKAGAAGAITIATNMAGRGTDINPSSASLAAGGLHVIAAEHHSSKRVDRQLAGRAARQGQPGSVRFYACWEDELFMLADFVMPHASDDSAAPHLTAETGFISKIQRQLERRSFERRRELVQRDHWMDTILETLARHE